MNSPLSVKRIVCLANSRKWSGRCIAGKEILSDGSPGAWVRPVSSRDKGEVSEDEYRCDDGSEPSVLDVIDVPVLNAQSDTFQRENWFLDPRHNWNRIHRITQEDLAGFVDPAAPLWINGYRTYYGQHDRIPLDMAEKLDSSLRLFKVDRLEMVVGHPDWVLSEATRRVRGRFKHSGSEYWLRVTDPKYEREYLNLPDGFYELCESYLTVSLGEAVQGPCLQANCGRYRMLTRKS